MSMRSRPHAPQLCFQAGHSSCDFLSLPNQAANLSITFFLCYCETPLLSVGVGLASVVVVDEVVELQAFPLEASDHGPHLLDGVGVAVVVAPGELGDIARQVLQGHAVVDAMVSPLQHGPEALQAVGVGHAVHPVAHGVLAGLVVAAAVGALASSVYFRASDSTCSPTNP